jgi:arylsulfatase A-like enzyme
MGMRLGKSWPSLGLLAVFVTVFVTVSTVRVFAARPNVVFLFADDMRPDAIAAYGNRHIRTPTIDRLVESGFSFRRNYCMGSTGGAVCYPSRAMLMSGRTLYRVPLKLNGVKLLPELLRDNGYATFGTGKWHNGAPSFLRGFEKGKAVMLGGMSNHVKVPIVDVQADGTMTEKRVADGFSSELFIDAAIDFLTERGEDDGEKRPFFVYVSFSAPHDPRQPPQKYLDEYYAARPPLPANFKPQHPFHNGWMTGRDEKLAAWPRTESAIRDQLAEYYGMITHMDAQMARFLVALEKTGEADNTYVIFSADHGLAVGSHGLLGKQNLYEQSMGCPLVFTGPGIPRGKESKELTYLYDIFPSICDLTGLTPPSGVEGQNLAPIWKGVKTKVRDTLFTTYEGYMRAVRDDRWKLIRYPEINHTQLFDLENDPHELHNLASDPAHAVRLAALFKELVAWQRRTDDKQPLVVENPKPKEVDLSGRARKPDRHQPDWIRKKYFGAD